MYRLHEHADAHPAAAVAFVAAVNECGTSLQHQQQYIPLLRCAEHQTFICAAQDLYTAEHAAQQHKTPVGLTPRPNM